MSKLIKLAERKNNLINELSLDPIYTLQLSLNRNSSFYIQHQKALSFNQSIKERIFEIFEYNMKEIYINTWGWNKDELIEEFFSSKSAYLLLYCIDNNHDHNNSDSNNNLNDSNLNENNLQAYIHFQFTWDDEDVPEYPVVYCFQLQISPQYQKCGLGKLLMSYLETITRKLNFPKMMLTCFKENVNAFEFYRKLGFVIDQNSPSSCGITDTDYEILSKEI